MIKALKLLIPGFTLNIKKKVYIPASNVALNYTGQTTSLIPIVVGPALMMKLKELYNGFLIEMVSGQKSFAPIVKGISVMFLSEKDLL